MTRRRRVDARWETPLPRGFDWSWGPTIAAHANAHLRDDYGRALVLDGWQRRALDRALACDADGNLAHRLYLLSTGRQNGKTVVIRPIAAWGLTDSPLWRSIRGLAYDRQQARIVYDAIYADATRPRSELARRLWATRMRGIRGPGGRDYRVASKDAGNALRGHTVDLALWDEVLTQRDDTVWATLLPAMSAVRHPFAFGASTAGTERSVLLRTWYERGLRICRGIDRPGTFGMSWYGADDGASPDDELAILAANPGIGSGRISWATITAERGLLTPDAFRRERLNVWTDAADEWLPPGVWARQGRPEQGIPADAPRLVLAVDASPSWRHATVTIAGRISETHTHVAIAGELDALRLDSPGGHVSPSELGATVQAAIATWGPALVVWDGSSAVGPHASEWAGDTPTLALSGAAIRQACAALYGALVGGELTHSADAVLTAQAHAARRSDSGDSWRLSRRASANDIDAILAATFAAFGSLTLEELPEPDIW